MPDSSGTEGMPKADTSPPPHIQVQVEERAPDRPSEKPSLDGTVDSSAGGVTADFCPPIQDVRLQKLRRRFPCHCGCRCGRGHDTVAGSYRYSVAPRSRLRNSLLGSVAFLELANACDFAANVWNAVPVPVYALVLMGLGGTFALVMCVIALWDARRAWHNIAVLRRERQALKGAKALGGDTEAASSSSSGSPTEKVAEDGEGWEARPDGIEVLLDVNFRELGGEAINREGMNVLLGFGALLICTGTLMAMGGSDPQVWYVSNLLSGYVGNTPLGLYSLLNTVWAGYVIRKARQHLRATQRVFGRTTTTTTTTNDNNIPGGFKNSNRQPPPCAPDMAAEVLEALRWRVRNVQVFCVVNGAASLVGGAASLMTATLWYGYAMLIPVIIASIFCNVWWRRRVGYDRPPVLAGGVAGLTLPALAAGVVTSRAARTALLTKRDVPFGGLVAVAGAEDLETVLRFLLEADLFEDFVAALFGKNGLGPRVLPTGEADEFTLEPGDLLQTPGEWHGRLVEAAAACVAQVGARHFLSREWYFLEVLGAYLQKGEEVVKKREP